MSGTDDIETAPGVELLTRAARGRLVAVSPDGRRTACLIASADGTAVLVRDVGGDGSATAMQVGCGSRRVVDVFWLDDDVVGIWHDRDGDEAWTLSLGHVSQGRFRALLPNDHRARPLSSFSARGNGIVIALSPLGDGGRSGIFRLLLPSGELEFLRDDPGLAQLVSGATDAEAGVRVRADGGFEILRRSGSKWLEIMGVPYEDTGTFRLLGAASDGSLILLSAQGRDKTALLALSKEGIAQLLYADDAGDVLAAWTPEGSARPAVVKVSGLPDRLVSLDRRYAAAVGVLNRRKVDVQILGSCQAGDIWLVRCSDPASGLTWELFDTRTCESVMIEDAEPELKNYRTGNVEVVTFETSDGLTLEMIITFPANGRRSGLAAVVAVHGGPWARDALAYSIFGQFCATRGYACVQINYRGSTGRGKSFMNAGDREWGRKMQKDVVEGVKYLSNAGILDPARIAVSGPSYGGYAALMLLTIEHEIFCCASAVSPPLDLTAMVDKIPDRWLPMKESLKRRIGDPTHHRDAMLEVSPISKIENIRRPVLIAHGARDGRLPISDVDKFVQSLKARNPNVTYLRYESSGHGLTNDDDLIDYLEQLHQFLNRHVPISQSIRLRVDAPTAGELE